MPDKKQQQKSGQGPSDLEAEYKKLFPSQASPPVPAGDRPQRINQPRIVESVVTYGAYEEPI